MMVRVCTLLAASLLATVGSAWSQETTWSSSPWKKMMGQDSRSTECIGARAS